MDLFCEGPFSEPLTVLAIAHYYCINCAPENECIHKEEMNSDLVEFDIFFHSTRPDGIEQSEGTNSIHIGGVLTKVKGQLHVWDRNKILTTHTHIHT